MQYYESDFDYTYNIPAASPCIAYESKKATEQGKKMFEKMNDADKDGIWQEDDCRCYFTIEEIELIQDK